MIKEDLFKLYDASKQDFYSRVFSEPTEGDKLLSVSEVLCAEVIYYMGKPTLTEFASFLNISPPNATYKVKQLQRKGYIQKTAGDKDKRQTYLGVTDKFMQEYRTDLLPDVLMSRLPDVATDEEIAVVERVLHALADTIED